MGCYCHILHNSVKHGHEHLLFDVETAILKIYSHFCRSSIRSQELAKYFEFIDQEQQVMKYICSIFHQSFFDFKNDLIF